MLALYASFLARTARILVSLDFAADARIAIEFQLFADRSNQVTEADELK
ncbi:hypothetical protein [Microcoleus sp. N3A4]